jgi:hypothetical protein
MSEHNIDYSSQEKLIRKILSELSEFDLSSRPPEFALYLSKIVEEQFGPDDFFERIKEKDNGAAQELLPKIEALIKKASQPLKESIRLSIAANIMDFALHSGYDIVKSITEDIGSGFVPDDYEYLEEDLKTAKKIAYIADNAGEIMIDSLVLKHIKNHTSSQIDVFVRGKPIINDATIKDARKAGIDNIAGVAIKEIDSVFPLPQKSGFLDDYDVILSKGQANYECLSEKEANIYFMLIAKCPVIARHLGVPQKSMVLKRR